MQDKNYTLDDFNYDLPDELIAQYPAEKREESRLLVLDRNSGSIDHKKFYELNQFLREGDLLVFNNARVINARIFCTRESGARVEAVLTERISERRWWIITNRTGRLKKGEILRPMKDQTITFTLIRRDNDYIEIETNTILSDELLALIGEIPLPPYIKRDPEERDRTRYQTTYAQKSGAVAAPTAGLHFTQSSIKEFSEKGVEICYITLFVSWGTFQPVRVDTIEKHRMHSERYCLEKKTAQSINRARNEGRRVIAVGTTSVRVLESTWHDGENFPGSGETSIFIHPPSEVRSINGLITNFHTPRSTLLMLVAAFAGYDTIMAAYQTAVEMRYRFFSYGDAMLIV